MIKNKLLLTFYKNKKIVKWLLSHGANVNTTNSLGHTPLMKCCYDGDLYDVLFYMRQCNANIDLKDNKGLGCLSIAAHKGQFEIIEHFKNWPYLFNSVDNDHNTPLMHCVMNYRIDCAKLLVNKLDKRNKKGDTALMIAADMAYLDMVQYLIQVGANPEIRNLKNETALTKAENSGDLKVVRFIEGVL